MLKYKIPQIVTLTHFRPKAKIVMGKAAAVVHNKL